jgi:hypothetical protein
MMQVKKLVLALAAVAATSVVTPSAFAANLLTTPIAVPSDNQIYLTGATAQTPGIAIAMSKMCASASTAGTFITLTDGASPAVGIGWKCDVGAAVTFTKLPGVTGPWIALKNQGGSLNGINPIRLTGAAGGTQQQLDATNCTLNTATTGTCPTFVAKPAHIGFADVSQKVFANRAAGTLNPIAPGVTYVQDIATGAGQGFGIVVSPALYALLATDQGVAVPSISKAQYASLITASNGFWSILLPNGTAHAASPLTIARRSTGSGTEASAEIYFLNFPCGSAPAPIPGALSATLGSSAGTTIIDGADTIIVKQESSSDAVLAEASTAAGYAIGVVSLENPEGVNSTGVAGAWKYVAINGIHPGGKNAPDWQRKNIVNGTYDFFFESFMFKNTTSTLGAAILNNINDFTNAIVADTGTGANLATSNGIFGDPFSAGADFGIQTNHYSRAGNECSTAQWVF